MSAGKRIDLDSALAGLASLTEADSMVDEGTSSPQTEAALASIRARIGAGSAPDAATVEVLFSEPLPQVRGENEQSASGSVHAPGSRSIHSATSSPPRHGTGSNSSRMEGSSMTQQAERRRDRERTSFQELAKLAQTPPPPAASTAASATAPNVAGEAGRASTPPSAPLASKPLVWPSTPNLGSSSSSGPWSGTDSDSGMVDLKAIASSDPNAPERAKSTPLAEEGLFEDSPASAQPSVPPATKPSPQVSSAAAVSAAVSSAPSAVASVAAPVPAQASAAPIASASSFESASGKKKGSAGLFIGVALLAAAAAGGFLFVRSHKAEAPATVAAAPEAKAVAQAPAAPEAKPVAQAPVDNAAAAPAPTEVAQDVAVNDPVASKKAHGSAKSAKGSAKPVADAPAAPAKEAPNAVATKEAAPAAGGPAPGSLQEEMQKRVGPDGKTPQVAADESNQVRGSQPKPSQGQVQGAIGAVLMKARECLGPDDPVSKAMVVFGSSGEVQSVTVSGGAAGKPAESCIKAALSKAKVPAFADPTYSFPVTVRSL